MTPIRKGEDWGSAGPLPEDGVLVHSDAEARAIVTEAKRTGSPVPALGLLGGDLARTLGARGDEMRLHTETARRLPVDLGSVLVDGRTQWFVAHLVARHSWWRGRAVAAMNAQWLGRWDAAPRAHPDDGLLDFFDADLPIGDRFKARRRLTTGTHVPHPRISQVRAAAHQFSFERPIPVILDAEPVGSARTLSVRVEADALLCVV